MRCGVDFCGGWEGVGSDDFPLTDSPMFGKSRIVGAQYCARIPETLLRLGIINNIPRGTLL